MHTTPWITTGQGAATPARTHLTAHTCSAAWSCRILLRPYSELTEFKWGWSDRDLAQEMLDRQFDLLEKLHALVWQPVRRARLALRFVQPAGGGPLSIFLHAKVTASSAHAAAQDAELLWRQLGAIFPYDYILEPISPEDQSAAADNLFESTAQPGITIIYPFVGTLSQLARQRLPVRLPLVFGHWAATPTSHENIWRALHRARSPAMLDILIKPALAMNQELRLLDRLSGQLAQVDSGSPAMQALAAQWGAILSQRAQYLQRAYVLQLRLATTNAPDSLANTIGASITTRSPTEEQTFLGFRTVRARKSERADWRKKIDALDFIPIRLPLSPALQRLPFLATIAEAHAVFRLPILSKGGIPALQMEYHTLDHPA